MSDKDYLVGTVGIPTVGVLNKKPIYLITLDDTEGKYKIVKKFIALDKPDSQNGFVLVKGFFTELDDDTITKKYQELLTSISKDLILDMWFPWHKINNIRSLVFNANKSLK